MVPQGEASPSRKCLLHKATGTLFPKCRLSQLVPQERADLPPGSRGWLFWCPLFLTPYRASLRTHFAEFFV